MFLLKLNDQNTLARVDAEVLLEVETPVALSSVLDALETCHPILPRGDSRSDHLAAPANVRFFVRKQDLSRVRPDAVLLTSRRDLSRRDNTDRSLARSAWESVPRKNRPVGTRKCLPWKENCIADHEHTTYIFSVVSVEFSSLQSHLRESHRTLRDGSFGVVLSQALRARLRSHRPFWTFPNRV